MKTTIRYLLPVFFFFLLSCGNAINSAGEEKDELAQNAAVASLKQPVSDTAAYRYLGYMYDEASGKDLNDSVFSGEVFERYEVEIQNAVNLMLRFPTRMLENVEGVSEEDAEGMAYTDWWRTLPDRVRLELNRLGKNSPDGMTEALKSCYSSGAENEAIDYYMNGIDASSGNFPARLRENVLNALRRTNTIRGGELINEVCDSICGFNLMQNGFLLQHYVYNDEGRVQLVDEKLGYIHNRLSDVENRLLSNASSFSSFQELMSDVDFKDLYQDMYDARVYMDGFYSQLKLLDMVGRKSRIKYIMFNSESSFLDLISSFIETNRAKVLTNKYKKLQISHIGIGYHVTGLIETQTPGPLKLYHPSIFIKLKCTNGYIPIGLDDIILLKRISINHLNVTNGFYSSAEILSYRKEVAENYYNTITIPLLKAINRTTDFINNSINQIEFPSVSPYPYVIGVLHLHIALDNTIIYDSLSETTARYQASVIIKDIIFNEMDLYNDYLIACASEVASWAIILKAHIAAAEGL